MTSLEHGTTHTLGQVAAVLAIAALCAVWVLVAARRQKVRRERWQRQVRRHAASAEQSEHRPTVGV